jgi:glycosyltransferase involved in cell wall biosynthesis
MRKPSGITPEKGKPYFSVIMPAWNVERYIDESIASVVLQTETNWELIIVDDGSTDRTPAHILDWELKDKRIRSIRQKNHGLSVARNAGIQAAKGIWLIFVDSDDMLQHGLLQQVWDTLLQNPDIDLVAYNAWSFEDGEAVFPDQEKDDADPFYGRAYLPQGNYEAISYYRTMQQANNFVASACLYAVKKTQLEVGIRFQPGLLHEDELFTRQLLTRCKKVYFLGKVLYFRRMRNGSLTRSQVSRLKVISFIRIANRLLVLYWKFRIPVILEDARLFYQKAVKLTESSFPKSWSLILQLLCSPVFAVYPWKRRIFRLLLGI